MDRQVIVLQGVSGSGKSTLAKRLKAGYQGVGTIEIVSADSFFYDRDGNYKHDVTKLDDAHNECFRQFLRLLVSNEPQYILVDNTNALAHDCAPYMRAASAFGWMPRILRVECPWETAKGRNNDRAPSSIVAGQARNLDYEQFPAYWKRSSVKSLDIHTDVLTAPIFERLLRWPVLTK